MKRIKSEISKAKNLFFNRLVFKPFNTKGKNPKVTKKEQMPIIDITNSINNITKAKATTDKHSKFIVELNESNESYFIEKSKFDLNGKLIIVHVDTQQKYLLIFVFTGLLILSVFFFTRYRKANNKPKTNSRSVYKYFCLGLSIVFLYLLCLFTLRINTFIKKIYLLSNGKTIEVSSYFKKFTVDIKDFNLLDPNDETYLTKEQYSQQYTEGFPIRIKGSIYILSRSSIVYEKSVLGKIGKRQYLDVI